MLLAVIAPIAAVPAVILGLQFGFWAALAVFVGGVLLQALAVVLYVLHLFI